MYFWTLKIYIGYLKIYNSHLPEAVFLENVRCQILPEIKKKKSVKQYIRIKQIVRRFYTIKVDFIPKMLCLYIILLIITINFLQNVSSHLDTK